MPSVKTRLTDLGGPNSGPTVDLPGGFHSWPADGSLRTVLRAARSPGIGRWTRPVERAFDNRRWTEECQGVTSDGHHWYLTSNNDEFRGVYKFSTGFALLGRARVPSRLGDHVGDLDYHDGRLYAQMEPDGHVAIFDTTPRFVGDARLTENGGDPPHTHFPWCAVNPWNGYLYSSTFDGVDRVYAYDPAADFDLVGDLVLAGGTVDGVQGGCFSTTGRLYLSSSDSNDVRAYSALNGQYFGRRSVAVDRTADEEVEGLTVWPTAVGGTPVQVHLVLLDNDWTNRDDVILKHFAAPVPSLV